MSSEENKEIKLYLLNKMSVDEVMAFEKNMSANPDLAKEVALQKIEYGAMKIMLEEDIRKKMQQWDNEKSKGSDTEKSKLRFFLPRISIAVSILLIAGLATFLWIPNNYSNKSLATTSWELSSTRSYPKSAGGELSFLEKGIQLYTLGEYDKAIEIFQSISLGDKGYEWAQRLIGHCFFERKDYTQSIKIFKKIIARNNSIDHVYAAEWYLLLSYLANDQLNDEFYMLLNKLCDNPYHHNHKKAKRLKEKLNSFWRKLVF